MKDAAFPDAYIVAYIHLGIKLNPLTQFYIFGYHGKITYVQIVVQGSSLSDDRHFADTCLLWFALLIKPEKGSEGFVGIFHPDQGGRYWILGTEIFVYNHYAGLSIVDVLLVFGIGQEGQGHASSLFNLAYFIYTGFGITFHPAFQEFSDCSCSKIHFCLNIG